ncbi:hypothetical protein [Hymenobacter jeollabukensis]|uniref:DUF4377 domain-containing protein n=1 Tax=Hymenobacter jeollabukensis TaxID=2025313 RepID=A0A5R8WLZ3_9BACT|nr:hypothetical protein [Hymenobacter jeollabukensis]TLM89835.1 hypothetical protein FDY95_19720 [Hymenobacter jeollabukensis]
MTRRLLSLLAAVALLPLAFGCQDSQNEPNPDCKTYATIRDLTGLDGCGFVLELADGKRLEPHGELWQKYAKHDGERVTISYVSEPAAGICMVGEGVKLTCIQLQVGWCGTPAANQGR